MVQINDHVSLAHQLLLGSQVVYINLYMLQTNCKLDQFVNGPPVYTLVVQFLNWLACF